uniref:NADH-ubiquinone oxidoreductase chain 2 n=1 Tax=Cucujoidea sp. 15 KM-2017 TaxID=2219351 RepID=A0A346RH43_9CUCU|nr:NADH dehydrogenase subunit 2 [Cucujoidea sp. 15 KM-2017]
MLKLYKFMFLNILMMGTMITVSSYSWFSMWMGLEINLLSVIPLFNSTKNTFPSESALKYFLSQSMASSILLFAIICMIYSKEALINFSLIINSALLMKLGAAPFHFWFPEVMEGLNWFNSLLLLTWQKIAPMTLIFYSIKFNMFFFNIIIFCAFIGSFIGLNQISLRKILAYSSITHISWMLSSLILSSKIWIMYFSIYSIISIILIWMLNKFNILYLYQLTNFPHQNKMINYFFFMNLLSLGGLPPFLGFLPKMMVILLLTKENLYLLAILMIFFVLINLFFYIRLIISSMMNLSKENILFKSISFSFLIWMLTSFNLMGLLITPFIALFL